MERINIDKDWELSKAAPAIYFPLQGMIGGSQKVNLPHDCNIDEDVDKNCPDGMQVAYYKGNMGVYTKNFEAPMTWEGRRVYVQLDGAYCNTEIVLNGHLIDMHPNGYAPFCADLTDYLLLGKNNRLAIFVNNSMGRTARWYSGAGIYRHIDLRVGSPVHIAIDGIFVSTKEISNDFAVLDIAVEVENHLAIPQRIKAEVTLHKDKGHGFDPETQAAAASQCVICIQPGSCASGRSTMIVENPMLWDIESPNLYVAKCVLTDDSRQIDCDTVLCGIRTITVDARNGLRLNGKTIKIKGGCMHHDNGILGAASFYDSEYRRLKRHKDNGYNGIRGAHNPMSKDMLEACDRLGLLMYAEAFDVWRMFKNANDYHLFFEQWWDKDLTAFIKRDRNHPCIFAWSIGNEITERNHLKGASEYAMRLSKRVRALDTTRVVSAAVPTLFNGMNDEDTLLQLRAMKEQGGPGQNLSTDFSNSIWADRTEGFCAPLDVVGYNYLCGRYEKDHEIYPQRVICGTESYPGQAHEYWEMVEKLPYVIGDFTWVSQDYLGETTCGKIIYQDPSLPPIGRGQLQSGEFPGRTANCGDFDLCGNDMPALHFRKIVWGSTETFIAAHNPKHYGMASYRTNWAWDECYNSWYFPEAEGKKTTVEVYSRAETVELMINGKSQGFARAGKENHFKAAFDVVYEPGCIEAISYTAGQRISDQRLETPGPAVKIAAYAENSILKADGQSLCYVNICVVDADGNLVPHVAEMMQAQVEGQALLAAFGSANPMTAQNYTTGEFLSYEGRIQAIVRSGYEKGKALLVIKSENYGTAEVEITVEMP